MNPYNISKQPCIHRERKGKKGRREKEKERKKKKERVE